MILPIRTWPDPVLLKACEPWDFDNPKYDYDWLETNLGDTLRAGNAIGLAANQVGISLTVMLIDVQASNELITMYNPVLVESSEKLWRADEGCLSFPGISLEISRPESVTIEYQDRNRNKYTRVLERIDAKCFLHELDHLNGRVFREYVSPMRFLLAQKQARKR